MAKPDIDQKPDQKPAVRLPSTSESRPAMIGLAVLLIVGGALASAYLALQAGNRADFVQVQRQIGQGAQISAEDLTTVSLPEGFDGGVPAGEMESLVDQSATVQLLPGTVLTRDMVSEDAGIEAGKAQLSLPVERSDFVESLRPGATMALDVADISGGGGSATVRAELVSVGSAAQDGITGGGGDTVWIVVSIDGSCAPVVAQGIRDDAVVPALLGSEAADNARAVCPQ